MPRSLGLALPLTVSLLFLSVAGAQPDDPSVWLDMVDEETFAAAGLNKLTDEELSVLGGLLIQPGGPSYLEQEAAAYLEANGWRPLEVVAVVSNGWKRRVIARNLEGPIRLEAWSSIELLPPPGLHWAKHQGTWEILNPDGRAQIYSD